MKLRIDTSDSAKVVLELDKIKYVSDSKKERSQRLLPFLDQVLKEQNLSLSDISEIEVNTGPGSFTGLRIGVSIAQALSWSLSIPLNSKIIPGSTIEIHYS